MKKTKIATLVIVLLGGIWVISSWMTGKKIEAQLDAQIQNLQSRVNEVFPDRNLKITHQDYVRGIFTSQVKLMVEAAENLSPSSVQQKLFLKETIDHGPFPLAQLKKLHLAPSWASIHTELENTPTVEKLFRLSKGEPIFQSDTRIAYTGATSSDIRLHSVDYHDPETGEEYYWKGGRIKINSGGKSDVLDVSGWLENASVATSTHLNSQKIPVVFTLNGLSFKGDTHTVTKGIPYGKQTIEIKKLMANVNGKNTLMIENMKSATALQSEGETSSLNIDYQLDNLKLEALNLGSGKLSLTVSKLDTASLMQAFNRYRSQIQAVSNEAERVKDPLFYQQRIHNILSSNILLLLKNNPEVKLNTLRWRNSGGESHFNLFMTLQDPQPLPVDNSTPEDNAQKTETVFKKLEGKLVIGKEMATELFKQIAIIYGQEEKNASQSAELQFKTMATVGVLSGLASEEGKNIVSRLEYADNQVTMNGKKTSLEQFLSGYFTQAPSPAEKIGGPSADPSELKNDR